MKAVRPGGVVVTCGATTGADPSADLQRLFFLQISVIGSTMGTLDELRRLIAFCEAAKVTPVVDQAFPLEDAVEAFAAMEHGRPGKFVLTV
jgi:D-arabinose 1-dehydrogenase-like Zn-dependent alcohol dehydrogenase